MTDELLSFEDYQKIWAEYGQKEVIETPFGQMVGKPTPEGSKIPYSDYVLTIEGQEVPVTGLAGGHGTLFFLTTKGRTGVKIDYAVPEGVTEYDDEDQGCKCDEDDDTDYSTTPETDRIVLDTSTEGFRTSKDFAIRVARWFNGGHPETLSMPVSVMRNGKVVDTERIPLQIQNGDHWRSITLHVMRYYCYGKLATVGMQIDAEKKNGGAHTSGVIDVTSVVYEGDVLRITGRYEDGSEDTVEVGVIDKPELKGKKVPKWFIEEMTIPMEDKDETLADKMLGGCHGIEWLHPIQEVQAIRTAKQTSLEAWL